MDGNIVSKVESCIVLNDMYVVGTPKLKLVDQHKLPVFIKLLEAEVKIIPKKLDALILKMGVNLSFDIALQDLKMPKRLQKFFYCCRKAG